MLSRNPTAFHRSLFCCFSSDSSPEWSILFAIYMWGKKDTDKGLRAISELYKMQCPVQLLGKASKCLKPLGNFESYLGKRCLQSNLVDLLLSILNFFKSVEWDRSGGYRQKKCSVWFTEWTELLFLEPQGLLERHFFLSVCHIFG